MESINEARCKCLFWSHVSQPNHLERLQKNEPTSQLEKNPPTDEVSRVINSSGGTIEMQGIAVSFEAGTFAGSTTVTIKKDSNVPVGLSSADGSYDHQNIFLINSTADSLGKPARITISYGNIIPWGASAEDLSVVHFTSNGWEFLHGSVDSINKQITFDAESFSHFAAGVPNHRVEFPTTYTPLDQVLTFENSIVPSAQIQSYDYSTSQNGLLHHDEYYWGTLVPPVEVDPSGSYGKVVYAAAFKNSQANPSFVYKPKVQACLVFKLDLSQVSTVAMELEYNSKSNPGYDYFQVEVSNSKLVSPLTNWDASWVKLSDQDGNKVFWGNGTWVHQRFVFPLYLSTFNGVSARTCGEQISRFVLVRIRFKGNSSGWSFPQNFGPFVDNIVFKTPNFNQAPTAPSNPTPANNATGQPTSLTLQWNASTDPEGDPITYDVYFGTTILPTTRVSMGQTGTTLLRSGLSNSTVYYWYVVAKDNHSNSTPSTPAWRFTTLAGPNGAPTAPSNPTPANNAPGQATSLTLQWNASTDPEGDPITYDVYFGTDNPPATRVAASQTGTTLTRSALNSNTTYYWYVVAKDNQSNSTPGSVWRFTTSGGTAPTVTTASITSITSSSATGGGNVTSQGSSSVTARGVCWSTSQNPTTADNKTNDGIGTGSFTSAITGLFPSTPYHVRAYATNSAGTSYGSDVPFTTSGVPSGTPCPGIPTVTYAGKTYNTVQVGSQCWLKENLDVGTRIAGNQGQTNNSVIEKYCYDNNPANCTAHGGLYQWDETMQYSSTEGARGICPSGWHVPTQAEYQSLGMAVGHDGNALKAIGQGTGGGAGTNTSGFSVLLSGSRYHDGTGTFTNLGFSATVWSSVGDNGTFAVNLELYGTDGNINLFNNDKNNGFSVRCIKD